MAIEPLLELHLADELVDADLLRRLHHAVDFDRPWPQLERLRCPGDALGRTELVEIVVVGIDLLVGNRAVERVLLIATRRIEVLGRIRQIADPLRERHLGRERQRGRAAGGEQGATIEEKVLGGGEAFGNLPPAAANDMHDSSSQMKGALFDYARRSSRTSHTCGRASDAPGWEPRRSAD